MLKWCLLQHEKMAVKYKLLLFSNLCETLIIRVFAPDGERSANSRLFFGVELKTRTRKSRDTENLKVHWLHFLSAEENSAAIRLMRLIFIEARHR